MCGTAAVCLNCTEAAFPPTSLTRTGLPLQVVPLPVWAANVRVTHAWGPPGGTGGRQTGREAGREPGSEGGRCTRERSALGLGPRLTHGKATPGACLGRSLGGGARTAQCSVTVFNAGSWCSGWPTLEAVVPVITPRLAHHV